MEIVGMKTRTHALQRWGANYSDDFFKQKIIYREISNEMNACLDNNGYFVNNKCYIITGENLIYLLCVLNSKLFNKIFLKGANTTGGKGADFLNDFNVPLIDSSILKLYHNLYAKLNQTNNIDQKNQIELDINSLVYKTYNLSQMEIDYLSINNAQKPVITVQNEL